MASGLAERRMKAGAAAADAGAAPPGRAPAPPAPEPRSADLQSPDPWGGALLKQQAYDTLLADILLLALRPGQRLDEQALVKSYGFGLAGVRDALGRLALEGLVLRRPRSATHVAPIDMTAVAQDFDVRAMLEPYCAGLAARYGAAADHAAIRAAYAALEQVDVLDTRALMALDRRFHAAVAMSSNNRRLAQMVMELHHRTARVWPLAPAGDAEAHRLDNLLEHKAVLDAVCARDVAAAEAAMRVAVGQLPQHTAAWTVMESTVAAEGLDRLESR